MLSRFAVWNSEGLAWFCLLGLVILGLPLTLCMPLWCDVTLYDVAARNVLEGGVHYRDVFDTNLPGMVWIQAGVRGLFGWSFEALRITEAVVLTGIILLLTDWLREMGVSRAGRIWFAVGVVLFYFSLNESCQCQRDTWMLLPALLAIRLRLNRLARTNAVDVPPLSLRVRFVQAAFEGSLWGVGIWIKPHLLIPIITIWIVSALWMSGPRIDASRRLILDTLGLIVGGVAVGGLGVAWLLVSGTWSSFSDVFLQWNTHYWAGTKAQLPYRYILTFFYFQSWSLIHLVALPLALCNLGRARFWSAAYEPAPQNPEVLPPTGSTGNRRSNATDCARAVLSALYLGWMAQALYFQRAYAYVHVAELILAMALVTAHFWYLGAVYFAWFTSAAVVWQAIFFLAGRGKVHGASPRTKYSSGRFLGPELASASSVGPARASCTLAALLARREFP